MPLLNTGRQRLSCELPASPVRRFLVAICAAACAIAFGLRCSRHPSPSTRIDHHPSRADEVLRTEKWYRALIQNSSDVIALISGEGTVLWTSPSIQRVLGYDSRDLVGRYCMDVAHPGDRAYLTGLFIDVLQNPERIYTGEFRHLRKDGSYCWMEGISRNLLTDPFIRAIVFTYRDIGDRKRSDAALAKAQAELRQYADLLEQKVARRTAQLEESLRSLERVLYHVAHDLRAPLRAMDGFTSLLIERSGSTDPEIRDYGDKIFAAAEHMDQLIGDLLEFGRLGHAEVKKEILRLDDQFAISLARIQEQIVRKQATLWVDRPMPTVVAHPRTLQQVLGNLLENALKFSKPEIPPEIRIWTEPTENRIRVNIQDNGIGIAPEYQEKIFGVFERLHSTNSYPGTGIGLAIVKKAMERLGGTVGVLSTPGQGSCFWIELPKAGCQDILNQ